MGCGGCLATPLAAMVLLRRLRHLRVDEHSTRGRIRARPEYKSTETPNCLRPEITRGEVARSCASRKPAAPIASDPPTNDRSKLRSER